MTTLPGVAVRDTAVAGQGRTADSDGVVRRKCGKCGTGGNAQGDRARRRYQCGGRRTRREADCIGGSSARQRSTSARRGRSGAVDAPAGEALKANTAPNEVTNPVVRTSASFCIIRVRTIEVPLSGPRCMSNGNSRMYNTDARTTLGSNGKNGQLLDNRMTTQSGVTPFIARCTHVRVRPTEYGSFNHKNGRRRSVICCPSHSLADRANVYRPTDPDGLRSPTR